ncbi:type I pullulanase [Mucilaginibacter sp. PPCGB 2223]|uniref:type I pullulanase n=1 Tax=Mucilaginibacter sp. PPCGB 2223 TaxID=1886027 RepID=UPI000826D36A|nr:type I pullulanase [Mucilaginibacter sp. PPCGB 2223]OCX52085.1 type I pullulanase [Mucilaginibacter sp. PPCGB 2223]
MSIFKPVLLLSCLNLFLLPLYKTAQVADVPVYSGNDLGVNYTPAKTTFKVWAPGADEVRLRLYDAGEGGNATFNEALNRNESGVWVIGVTGDIKNRYYTFQVKQNGKWLLEAPDIYAKAAGVNGHRGMVVDLKSTDPAGWKNDKKPAFKNFTDAVIYETHVRDISISQNSGIVHKGKFLGLAETGTKNTAGQATGLDHLKKLGVTHVHLLPSFDYNTVDETKLSEKQYNWGYDPLNYNVPEGSYSTNPYNGNVRIKEFKQMVQALHANGLRVVLDVVYNHTSDAEHSNFNQFAPGYFYRMNADGTYANGTGCGNETASEKQMMHNFMVQSVAYWAKEYHLDGFRFDLMGIHDIETMNAISSALHQIDPTIIIYGEGWTAGNSPLPEEQRAVKKNTARLNQIAAFDDDMRDGLKGGWNDVKAKGFVSGAPGNAESVKFGIVAATQHPQVNYQLVNYSKNAWAAQPCQCINYVSCHDDNTLFDRLKISNPNATEDELIRMDKLSNAVVLTSQGVAFLHSGAEFLRTKQGVANSYKSPDEINQIDWDRKTKYHAVFNYYKQLVWLRRNHPAFRMPATDMIASHLTFTDQVDPCLIVYQIKGNANGDKWKNILIVINGNPASRKVKLPQGSFTLVGDENSVNEKGIRTGVEGELNIAGTALYILHN